ncbi:TIGR01777 family oxidoreductase [Motilimonas pumila]|uniref:TIGR01777 family protein n=1 Tax=Motilimonas pumila TaxID=2303987 RepID=A0A418YH28_9GAMM|nr:TIGR01777 family oxidoreductase [Motilimonas pumila]RJG49114.1 TIGR01777 family protein [Motilimonas pumila]
MKILITGGTGLIGSHLCQVLSEKHQLTVLSRNPTKAKQLLGPQLSYLADLESLANLDEYDAVINLAGEPIANKRWSPKQKDKICQSRWTITRQISQLIIASNKPPAVFISGSAIGFYGSQQEQPLTEADDLLAHDEFSHQICMQWEAVAKLCQDHTRLCILRTGVVLSPAGGALKKMLPPFRVGAGGVIGDGKQFMSWIHLKDMVRGIEWLLHNDAANGTYNFTAPHPVTNRAFTSVLAKVLNRPTLLPMPAFALKLGFGEMSTLLLDGQKVIPERLQQQGFEFIYSDLQPALKNLLLN